MIEYIIVYSYELLYNESSLSYDTEIMFSSNIWTQWVMEKMVDILKCILLNEIFWIFNRISQHYVSG